MTYLILTGILQIIDDSLKYESNTRITFIILMFMS